MLFLTILCKFKNVSHLLLQFILDTDFTISFVTSLSISRMMLTLAGFPKMPS